MIIWIMIGAGLLGGLANFLNGDLLEKPPYRGPWRTFVACITYGLVASGVVPLFLSTIHSDMLREPNLSTTSYLEFAGFCLLAAVFSRKFLESVADKALEVAKKAKEESDITTAQFGEIMGEEAVEPGDGGDKAPERGEEVPSNSARVAESAPPDLTTSTSHASGVSGASGDAVELLEVLANGPYLFRSVPGIKRQIDCKRLLGYSIAGTQRKWYGRADEHDDDGERNE